VLSNDAAKPTFLCAKNVVYAENKIKCVKEKDEEWIQYTTKETTVDCPFTLFKVQK
jgi:hypothetical protein